MHSPPPGDSAELALQELRRLVQGIRVTSHAVERSYGVTGAQLFVLRELSLEPNASIRRLSQRTLTDPSSVSVVVARLVARGLVKRTLDATDRRKSALTVTRLGERLLARAPEPYQGRLIAALRELKRADLRVLRRALSQLSDALEIEPSGAPLFFEDAKPASERRSRAART